LYDSLLFSVFFTTNSFFLPPRYNLRKRPAPLGVAYLSATFWWRAFILQSCSDSFPYTEIPWGERQKTAWQSQKTAI